MITFSAPTGEAKDGQMQTQEVQKRAFTHSRFLEFAADIAKISHTIQAPSPAEGRDPTNARRQPTEVGQADEGPRPGDAISATARIVRH
jgi:hypothetical protein